MPIRAFASVSFSVAVRSASRALVELGADTPDILLHLLLGTRRSLRRSGTEHAQARGDTCERPGAEAPSTAAAEANAPLSRTLAAQSAGMSGISVPATAIASVATHTPTAAQVEGCRNSARSAMQSRAVPAS